MRLSVYVFIILLSCFALLPIGVASAQNEYPKPYQVEVMNGLNDVRKEINLKELEVDPDLCILAEKVAVDSEIAYPKKIGSGWFSNPNYKAYLKNYSLYKSESNTQLDVLVDVIKKSNREISVPSDNPEILIRQFAENETLADTTITHACIGSSDGKQGYKPFSYFIGGVRKQSSWWDNFVNFFKNLF